MSGCEAQVIQSQGKSVVVAGNVQSYAVRGQYITGYADTTCIDPKTEPEARAGYFFIDTRNGQIMQALTEEQWKDELRALGWNNPNLNTVRTTKELRPPNSSAN